MSGKLAKASWPSYLLAAIGIAGITVVLIPLRGTVNSTTIGFGFLLGVLFVAIIRGSIPALFASVLAMLSFNFFFLPPFYTFTIADPQNWVALTAFFITALAVGQLSARAKQRAEIAEARGEKIERLYEELRQAFERASEAEALRRSERLKTALLEAVTHDLRTPLTSIKASATLLIEDRDDSEVHDTFTPDEQRTMLKVISEEVDRLDRFVESIVDLARIEAGDMQLQRNWGPVDEIIDAAVARAETPIKKHQLTIFVERDLPVIRVDARAVAEVIYALIENATKYAPAQTSISVRAERVPDEMVKISVEDEGPGIPLNLRERVFEKFFRGDGKAKSSQGEGLGMGLSIAKGIVEAHGGRIWIEDGTSGRGTRVSFTVPVGDDEPAPSVDSKRQELLKSDVDAAH